MASLDRVKLVLIRLLSLGYKVGRRKGRRKGKWRGRKGGMEARTAGTGN